MLYTESHEWVKPQGKEALIGVSKWAQKELGEVVFIQLPEVGKELKVGDFVCVLESTKAAADIYTPISGKILEVNTKLNSQPELINLQPETEGWVFKMEISDLSDLDALMGFDIYNKLVMQ